MIHGIFCDMLCSENGAQANMVLHEIEQPEKEMVSAYRRLFWGLFFMTFNINIGVILFFPNFIGSMIVVSGIGCFKRAADSSNLRRAHIVAKVMTAEMLIEGFVKLLRIELYILQHFSALIMGAMSGLMLLLIYDVFAASSDMLRINGNFSWADRLRKCSIGFIIIHTILSLAGMLTILIQETTLAALIAVCGVALKLWIVIIFAKLKREYEDIEPGAVGG